MLSNLSLFSSFLLISFILIIFFIIFSVFLHFNILIFNLNLLSNLSFRHLIIILLRCNWLLNSFMNNLQRVYFNTICCLFSILYFLKINFNNTAMNTRGSFNNWFFNHFSIFIYINLLLSSHNYTVIEFNFLDSCTFLNQVIRLRYICYNYTVIFLHNKWI